MKITALALLLLATGSNLPSGERWSVLPGEMLMEPSGTSSKDDQNRIAGAWTPNLADIRTMESEFHQLTDLSEQSERFWLQIPNPAQFYRQYFGVVRGGKKRIHIFAFCALPDGKMPKDWRKHTFLFVDSGPSTWSADYDAQSRTFLDLRGGGTC